MSEDRKTDPMVRDKKHLPRSGSGIIPQFLFSSLVVLPFLIAVLGPIAFLCVTVKSLFQKKITTETAKVNAATCSGKATSPASRQYDIIVFGSTGFTGKMAAVYIAKQYGTSIKWAIAGRRQNALEDVRKELVQYNANLGDLPIVLADSFTYSTLEEMANKTRVIITTAGPFDKYGSELVRACAENGTHYCDITGETDWVRKMIDQYDVVARESGARIVHFCGHDCVPWDLAVLECSKELKKKGEILTEVHCYDEIRADPSGGTLATVFHSLENRVKYKSTCGFDPLLKCLDKGAYIDQQGKATTEFLAKNQSSLGYSKEFGTWCGPFLMAMVMANCVRRSAALNQYGPKLVYKEAMVYASWMAGCCDLIQLAALGASLVIPPMKTLLMNTMLPNPGEGPSEKAMDKGFLKVTAIGFGDSKEQQDKVQVELYFPTDPGYRDTARMLVESGLVLALELPKVKVGGGVYTPAACQGSVLLERLVATGSHYLVRENTVVFDSDDNFSMKSARH